MCTDSEVQKKIAELIHIFSLSKGETEVSSAGYYCTKHNDLDYDNVII